MQSQNDSTNEDCFGLHVEGIFGSSASLWTFESILTGSHLHNFPGFEGYDTVEYTSNNTHSWDERNSNTTKTEYHIAQEQGTLLPTPLKLLNEIHVHPEEQKVCKAEETLDRKQTNDLLSHMESKFYSFNTRKNHKVLKSCPKKRQRKEKPYEQKMGSYIGEFSLDGRDDSPSIPSQQGEENESDSNFMNSILTFDSEPANYTPSIMTQGFSADQMSPYESYQTSPSSSSSEMLSFVAQTPNTQDEIIRQLDYLSGPHQKGMVMDAHNPGYKSVIKPFILYCNCMRPAIRAKNPFISNKDLMREIGKSWIQLAPAEKLRYQVPLSPACGSFVDETNMIQISVKRRRMLEKQNRLKEQTIKLE